MKTPHIKLLKTKSNYYFYDVNFNKIVRIKKDSYDILDRILSVQNENYFDQFNDECKEYFQKGLLGVNQIERVDRGLAVNDLIEILDTNMKSLLLQVTRDCNLRCKYCFYSGEYMHVRTHQSEYMDISLAKKVVDYFFDRAQQGCTLNVGFYGGEPLLNFKLIQEVVNYILITYPGRNVVFSITTNGILLSPTVWAFLEKYKFLTTISVDGPKEVHDANRVLKNGEGSFDTVIRNITYCFKTYEEYYKSNVKFNAVVTQGRDKINTFFSTDPILQHASVKFSDINGYHENSIQVEQENSDRKNEHELKNIHRIRSFVNYLKYGDQNGDEYSSHISGIIKKLKDMHINQLTHAVPAGLCIPGVSRLFATTKGDFFMCEKVDENREDLKIGNVFVGWHKENIMRLSNISNESVQCGCKTCWAIHLCNMCAAKICALGVDRLNDKCNHIREIVAADLKDVCMLYEIQGEV